MRCKVLLAALAAASAFALVSPAPAEAGFRDRLYRLGSPEDPYSYVPHQPRYYPYYNSGYWRPAEEMRYAYRYRFALPKYYQAWGWNSRKWALKHPHPAHARR